MQYGFKLMFTGISHRIFTQYQASHHNNKPQFETLQHIQKVKAHILHIFVVLIFTSTNKHRRI